MKNQLKMCFIILSSLFFLGSLDLNADQPMDMEQESIMELVYKCENNSDGWPGLHWAINYLEHPEVVLEIIKLFPDEIFQQTTNSPIWETTGDWANERDYIWGYNPGYSSLELAVKKEYSNVVQALLGLGVDPNIRRMERKNRWHQVWTEETPLGLAIQLKNKEIIKMLLAHGASVEHVYQHTTDYRGRPAKNFSAFMYALEHFPDEEVLKLLIIQGMKIKHKPEQIITEADLELFKKYTSDPTATTGPWPPLHHSFYAQDYEAAKRLLDLGAHWDRYLYPEASGWQANENINRPQDLDNIAWKLEDSKLLILLLEENIFAEPIFLRAVAENRIDIVIKAVELNIQSENAVFTALKNDNLDIFYLLIDQNYLISKETISYAIGNDLAAILTIFFDKGVEIPVELINENCFSTKPAILEVFLDRGYVFDPLILLNAAIENDSLAVVKLTVERYGVSNEIIKNGIRTAVKLNRQNIFQYLNQISR